ncbi:MAG: hypothetical protein QOG85_3 [Gaiellaceae bacterium]|nr:hypothetical protein [Gaiellaceae bacterium]
MPEEKPSVDDIMQYFTYEHLPERLWNVSKPFCELAKLIVGERSLLDDTLDARDISVFPLKRNAERSVSLRKLLEAKDAAVRAAVAR